MLAELGVWLLCVSLLLALWPLLPLRLPIPWATMSGLQCASIAAAMAVLIALFVDSDFSVALVAAHSHTQKPLLYKIAAAWGQHEGSMLLWALVLATAGAFWCARHESDPLTPVALRVQSALLAGTVAFILFTSNPFERLWMVPMEGQGLNPLLQDVGLALHPPMLYFGYVGLSLVFSLAVAAMRLGCLNADWARHIRPWVLMPWCVLTLGIGLGSWWAYRELGWGGWWFWDPVENASFIPWLIATALLHSIAVLEKRGQFARWVGFLATLGFACSLLGTFLVRSGVLTSVHAFASDPARGVYILVFLTLAVGYAFLSYARFAGSAPDDSAPIALSSRTHALLLNNLLLMVVAATILTGTLYPVILQALHAPPVSVGAPYYRATLGPMAVLLFALGGLAPHLGWNATAGRRLRRPLAVLLGIVACAVLVPLPLEATLAVLLGGWVGLGSLGALRFPLRARNAGMVVAHLGLGLFVAAAGINHATKEEHAIRLQPGETAELMGKQVAFLRLETDEGPNYFEKVAVVVLRESGTRDIALRVQQREYPTERQTTNEAAIAMERFGDWYAVAEMNAPDAIRLRLLREPCVPLIWLAIALMALGGVCSCATGIGGRAGTRSNPPPHPPIRIS